MTEKNGVGFLLLGLLAPQARAQDDPRASSAPHHAAATDNGPVKIVRESTERFHDVQKSAVRDDQIKRDAPIRSAPRAASRMRVGVSGESTHRSGVSTRDPTRPQRHRATPFDRLQRREGASTRSSGASASFRHARRRPRLPRATAGGARSGVDGAARTTVREGLQTERRSSQCEAPIPRFERDSTLLQAVADSAALRTVTLEPLNPEPTMNP